MWLHRLLTDNLCSNHQSRQPLLPNNPSNHNHNHNHNNPSNSNRHSSNHSRQAMVLLDQLPKLPNPPPKSALNLQSLKSTSPSNSECRHQCRRRRRACHHNRYSRFRRHKRKRVPTQSRSRRRKYMPNYRLRLRLRFKRKHKVRLRLRSVVYLLVRTSRHHIIPGQRRLRQVSVSHSKLLPLGLLSLLRMLV